MNFSTDTFQSLKITGTKIPISKDAILNYLGYEEAKPEPHISDLVSDQINRTRELIIPDGGYIIKTIKNIDTKAGILEIDNQHFQVGKIITHQLKNARYLVLFIFTISRELEKLSDQLFNEGEMLEGYITNLIGSEAADGLAEYFHRIELPKILPSGTNYTNRFSPGYCNWDVAEQHKLFSMFPQSFRCVSLTESALMNPVKSVSGLIGIGENVKFQDYKCKLCGDKTCLFRKKEA